VYFWKISSAASRDFLRRKHGGVGGRILIGRSLLNAVEECPLSVE